MSLPPELGNLLDKIQASINQIKSNELHRLETDRPITQEVFHSLSTQVKEELDRINEDLDDLEVLADECEDDSTRSDALQIVEDHRKQAARLRTSLRKISLELKQQLSNTLLQSSRAQLLSGATSKPQSSNPEEALMSASSDVTQSLRNTLEIMRQELDRSVLSTHMLEQQTSTLQLTSDQYSTFGELMKTSRALISSLKRADLLDRVLLSGALLIFFLVCVYILKKRIFDRGISLISTIISPLNRQKFELNHDKMMISSHTSNPDDILTAAAAIATATAAALTPSLATPDLAPHNPPIQAPADPLPERAPRPDPDLSSQAHSANHPINPLESGLLHEEL